MSSDTSIRNQLLSVLKLKWSNPLPFRVYQARSAVTQDELEASQRKFSENPSTSSSLTWGSKGQTDHGTEYVLSSGKPSAPAQPRNVNIVLFGETGVGKSSLINLIAQKEVAKVSSDVNGCTMQSTRYDISFDGMDFSIFDTIGLEEPQMGVNGYLKAIEKAYELIMKLGAVGGVHLLLFCMRGGRITATTQSNYRLFCELLCSNKVPIALVFTGLDREEVMENWWDRNKCHIKYYGISSNDHACVSTVRDESPEDHKYEESQAITRSLLKKYTLKDEAFLQERDAWFVQLGKGMRNFIERRRSPTRDGVVQVLMHRCKLDPETARKFANMMENDMDRGDPSLYSRPRLIANDVAVRNHPSTSSGSQNNLGVAAKPCDKVMDTDRERHIQELEELNDVAKDSRKHDEAIGHSLLDPTNLLKHSNEVIQLDPESYKGYEEKHAALHRMCYYTEAFETFKTMLSKLEQSPDTNTRDLRTRYIDATSAIQKVVIQTIHDMPSVLINTDTGRLYDKTQQAEAFEKLPIYDELRSSMTTRLDVARIRKEVKEFYRYVMLSHKWQAHEPTFQQVKNTSIYQLPLSPVFDKLLKFCRLACSLGFKWAWTDTCCVDQRDRTVQQESVVAMFRWYRGSSLTIVHLVGVLSESQMIGHLRRSIWNTRGWTYQEYVASTVVQFYTEDWKPYLGLQVFNHKESQSVLSEMEQAMNFATRELTTLQPGLDRARAKLYLASMRQTTRHEDIAYCLFGIFGVALPVVYGEGNLAISRFLEHILTRSADVTLLAWTGDSGSHHSYLPVDLTVYNQILPPHIPPPLGSAVKVSTLNSPSDSALAVALYNQLYALPTLSLVSGRLRLPGIVFPVELLVPLSASDPDSGLPMYRATTPVLWDVLIKTSADLTGMGSLLLIHPWIGPLLDRDFSRGVARFDLAKRAARLVGQLRQPFGALLLAPSAREQYRRVATDSLIIVRLREGVSLTTLMDGVRMVDVQ